MPAKFLMCPPDFYSIEYSINPWMHPGKDQVSSEKTTQWQVLFDTFKKIGVEVELVQPQSGLPDMTYVDVGVLWDKTFIPSNFKFPERQPERAHFINWFREHGYEIAEIDQAFSFEGHGDTLWAGKKLFCGYGFRSTVEAHQELRGIFKRLGADVEVIPVELVDDRFYHLDTCFCPLDDQRALVYKAGVSAKAYAMLEKNIELIEISEADALKFACNAVVTDGQILIPAGAAETNAKLAALGYAVHEIPMTEFMKGGGACKCLSMPL